MIGVVDLPVNEENLPLICEKLQEAEVRQQFDTSDESYCFSQNNLKKIFCNQLISLYLFMSGLYFFLWNTE